MSHQTEAAAILLDDKKYFSSLHKVWDYQLVVTTAVSLCDVPDWTPKCPHASEKP